MNTLRKERDYTLYETDTPYVHLLRFGAQADRFDPVSAASESGAVDAAELRNRISSMLFRYLEHKGVASLYLDTVTVHDMRVRHVDPIRIRAMIRNVVTGNLAQRLGLDKGVRLERPLIEWYYDNEQLGDPLLNDAHASDVLRLATPADLQEMRRQLAEINQALIRFWEACNLLLVDATMSFGHTVDGQLLVAGPLTLDNLQLWDQKSPGERAYTQGKQSLRAFEQEVYARMETAWPKFDVGPLADT